MSQITAKAKASWTLLNLREAKHWASYRLTLSAKAPGICLWHKTSLSPGENIQLYGAEKTGRNRGQILAIILPRCTPTCTISPCIPKNSPWRFVSTNTISFSSGGESRGGLCAAARPSQQHGYTGSVRTGLVDDSDTIKYERRAEKGCRRGVEQLVPRGGLHEVPDPVCRGLELPLQVVPLQPVLPPAAVKLIQTQVRVRVRPGPPERLSGVGPGRVGTGARGGVRGGRTRSHYTHHNALLSVSPDLPREGRSKVTEREERTTVKPHHLFPERDRYSPVKQNEGTGYFRCALTGEKNQKARSDAPHVDPQSSLRSKVAWTAKGTVGFTF
ncbi:hypothetical protein F7725_027257 [Dissostichus mawsoni]|uniref:Uncharacterized protein n=1 Tax=Dissostichus mawsoni TaxID=36200 RepID=A0A7J5XDC1_DISMA|nr:hypothetical protein F7725_027257 [Dissostichus mawsoni]